MTETEKAEKEERHCCQKWRHLAAGFNPSPSEVSGERRYQRYRPKEIKIRQSEPTLRDARLRKRRPQAHRGHTYEYGQQKDLCLRAGAIGYRPFRFHREPRSTKQSIAGNE